MIAPHCRKTGEQLVKRSLCIPNSEHNSFRFREGFRSICPLNTLYCPTYATTFWQRSHARYARSILHTLYHIPKVRQGRIRFRTHSFTVDGPLRVANNQMFNRLSVRFCFLFTSIHTSQYLLHLKIGIAGSKYSLWSDGSHSSSISDVIV